MSQGSFQLLEAGENVLAYMRTDGSEKLLVAINFVGKGAYQDTKMSALQATTANILSTFLDKYNNNNVGFCGLTGFCLPPGIKSSLDPSTLLGEYFTPLMVAVTCDFLDTVVSK